MTTTATELVDQARAFIEYTDDGRMVTRRSSKLRGQPDDVRGIIAAAFEGKRVRVTTGTEGVEVGRVVTVARLMQHSYPYVLVLDPGPKFCDRAFSTATIVSIEELSW